MHVSSDRPVAIVTGAARGIGRACALALGASGFNVVVVDVEGHAGGPLRVVEQELRDLGVEPCGVVADVARAEQHEALVAAAITRWAVSTAWSTTPASG
jgi:NAD(P)-dependent dehydrogenase (short-subunit alcohol dehydrogenase family)